MTFWKKLIFSADNKLSFFLFCCCCCFVVVFYGLYTSVSLYQFSMYIFLAFSVCWQNRCRPDITVLGDSFCLFFKLRSRQKQFTLVNQHLSISLSVFHTKLATLVSYYECVLYHGTTIKTRTITKTVLLLDHKTAVKRPRCRWTSI